jgi:hypothetical protein
LARSLDGIARQQVEVTELQQRGTSKMSKYSKQEEFWNDEKLQRSDKTWAPKTVEFNPLDDKFATRLRAKRDAHRARCRNISKRSFKSLFDTAIVPYFYY